MKSTIFKTFMLASVSLAYGTGFEITISNNKKIIIERGDITQSPVDAIVNAANNDLVAGGGVCGAIFEAAGQKELQEYCHNTYHNRLGVRCGVGQAVMSPSFKLQDRGIKYVIHAVGPDYRRATKEEISNLVPDNLLQETYHNAINLILQPLYDGGQRADRYITIATEQIKSIAFPFISSGIYAFPRPKAAAIAIDTLIKELRTLDQNEPDRELTIRIVLFSDADLELFSEMYQKTQIMNLWPL